MQYSYISATKPLYPAANGQHGITSVFTFLPPNHNPGVNVYHDISRVWHKHCITNLGRLLSIHCPQQIRQRDIVSVLGREEGYTVKYTPSAEGAPEGSPEGKGVYLTIYSESSPNMESISF